MKLLFIFPAIILLGCEVVIPIDVSSRISVVVDGVFNPDSVWSVKLSLNKRIAKNSPTEKIPDNEIKTVTIRDENNALIESLQYKPAKADQDYIKREYIGQTKPEFNKTYRLEIETRSYGTITSSGHVPPKVPVTSATTELIKSDKYKGARDRLVTVEFSDDGNTANFYEIYLIQYYVWRDDDGKVTPPDKWSYGAAQFSVSDPAYSEKVNNNKSLIFDDTLFSGKAVKLSLKITGGYGELMIVLRNMTEDLYKVTSNRELQRKSDGNPFAEPLLIKGNVQNGYGIFSGFSASVYTY